VAILVGRLLDASLGVAAVAGVIAAAIAFAGHWRWDRILHERHGGYEEVLFPSPWPAGAGP
jgi:hypothetical protein